MWSAVALVFAMVLAAGGQEIAPTHVLTAEQQQRTKPPTEVVRPQYVQTLYKATDYSVAVNTLIPFWPTYEVEHRNTSYSTVNNQTISTSTAEFSTVMNSTVWYYDSMTSNTSVAPTTFQTMEFQHQTVLYTDRTQNITHTQIQNNSLPFL
ncbi:uncharacterized protein [Panulirus ornatus]|uniref:uncharacterized protein n=1 Tax=Panulirus ornatus TaxID=150431 RepID=UPI003A87E3BB